MFDFDCIPSTGRSSKMDASLQLEKLLSDTDHLDSGALQKERCSHFTIRGYVSDVRKRNKKICWPFPEFQNPIDLDYKHENVLPPLAVADFKWWNCKRCLRKTSHALEGPIEITNDFLGTCNRLIQSGLLVPYDEHRSSKLNSLKKVIKHRSMNTSAFRTMGIPIDNETIYRQQKSEVQTTKPLNSMSTIPYVYPSAKEKSSEEFDVLVNENRPICRVASTEKNKTVTANQFSKSQMKKRPYHGKLGYSLFGLKKCGQKVCGEKISRSYMFADSAPKVILSDESKDSESVKDYLNGSKTSIQHVNNHHNSSNSNGCWNKKSQKTRTMDDILKSDVLGMTKKTPVCDRQLSSVKRKNGSESKSDAYRDQKQNGTEEKEKSNKIMKTKRLRISEIDEDEFPLMHWIARIPDRAKMVKPDGGGTKKIDHSNISKSESVVPFGKQLNFMVKSFGSDEGNKKVISQGKKQCRASDDESLQEDIMSRKKCTDGKFGKINSRITVSNSSGDLLTAEKKGSKSKKQSTIPPRVDSREHPPVRCAKEFLETSDNRKVADSSLHTINEKATKEKISRSDLEAVDGVPVEILKLLQENWLKRQSVNTECSDQRLLDISEMNKETTKNGISLLDLNRSNQDEMASSSVKIHAIDSKSTACGVEEHEMSTSFMKIHDRSSFELGKASEDFCHEYDFGIAKFNASNGNRESSYFRERKSGVTLPLINSLENQSRHHSSHKMGYDPFREGYEWFREENDLFQDYPHYKSYAATSNLQSEMTNSSDILLPAQNFLGKHSQTILMRKPRNMALERVESAINSTGHLQNKSKKNLQLSNVSGFDLYNSTRTMSPPSLDLYKNDTYSAMHLLRLMDPAVSSSVPLCPSIDRIPQPDLPNFNLHRELVGTSANLRPNQPFIHPAAATDENLGPSRCHNHCPVINSNVSFELQRHRTSSLMDNTCPPNSRPSFSVPRPVSLQKKSVPEVNIKSQERNHSSNMMELCVLNRNPADFTDPDESNEYMIGFAEPTKVPLIYPNPNKKKQRAMKLTALKGLLRN